MRLPRLSNQNTSQIPMRYFQYWWFLPFTFPFALENPLELHIHILSSCLNATLVVSNYMKIERTRISSNVDKNWFDKKWFWFFKSSKKSKITNPLDSNMLHFAFAHQFSMSCLILVIWTRQSTANDEAHDKKPAKKWY